MQTKQKINGLFLGVALSIALSFASIGLGQELWPWREVDFNKINPVMSALMSEVIHADELFEMAVPQFDPTASSIKKSSLKYSMEGKAKNVPWLENGVAQFSGTTIYDVISASKETGIEVVGEATVKTDFLALARYAGYIALKKADLDHTHFGMGEDIRAHLRRLSVTRTFEDLHEILRSSQVMANKLMDKQIQEQKDYIKKFDDGLINLHGPNNYSNLSLKDFRRSEVEELKAYEKAKRVLNSLQILKLTGNQNSEAIEVSGAGIQSLLVGLRRRSDKILPVSGRVRFGYQQVSVTGTVFAQMEREKLNTFREKFQSMLIGIEQNSTADKDDVRIAFRGALYEIKRFIQGKVH